MVNPNELFSGPKAKVERANHHIDEIHGHLVAYLKTRPYHIRVDVDPQTGQNFLRFQVTKTPPKEVPLIIGDAVHNLRTALDLLASEIVRRSGECDTSVHFPFHETRQNLVDAIEKGPIKRASPHAAALILDHIRPYSGGNDDLWRLNKLDVLDKHRILIVVVAATRLTGVSLKDDNNNVFENMTVTLTGNGLMTPLATKGRLEITNYGEPALGVFFGKNQPFEGKSVLHTLTQLAQQVAGTVESIAVAYGKG